jgi:hypothetical protein
MRYILSFLFLFLFYSCNSHEGNSVEINKNDSILASLKRYTLLVGQWRLCAESFEGQMIYYNQCPEVVFDSDGYGAVIYGAGKKESFKWNFNLSLLKLTNDNRNVNTTFSDTNYIVLSKDSLNIREIEIRKLSGDHSLYLSRK